MKIAFHSGQLSLRGTEIALFDYARQNEDRLGNESVILYSRHSVNNHLDAIQKFQSRFRTIAYEQFSEVNALVESHAIDLFYTINSGRKSNDLPQACPTAVHAVFPRRAHHRHGDRYAFVSKWLSDHCSWGRTPFVPHIVSLPEAGEDLRTALNIPRDALVIGGYGGETSFDVPFAPATMLKALETRSDLVFLFMNFPRFIQHERALFLPGSADMNFKADFIEACDAMLHARLQGESFGLACGEFSIKNRPVITYGRGKHRSHLEILGKKAFVFNNPKTLLRYLTQLDRAWLKTQDWDCYSAHFNEKVVMNTFKNVFIDPLPPKRPWYRRLV